MVPERRLFEALLKAIEMSAELVHLLAHAKWAPERSVFRAIEDAAGYRVASCDLRQMIDELVASGLLLRHKVKGKGWCLAIAKSDKDEKAAEVLPGAEMPEDEE